MVAVIETEDDAEHMPEEVNNEDNAIAVMRNEEKAIAEDINVENAVEEEENEEDTIAAEENEGDDMEEEEEEEGEENPGEEQNEKKVEAITKEKVRKPRNRRKKGAQGGSEMIAIKDEDKPESSGSKKGSKKVESMGMIFMCSSQTKKDCFRYKVLGLPASKRDIVQKVYKGMRLFLFDVDLRLMYGIYKAAEPGGYNIEPKAFKSAFPSQVRYTVLEDCLPLAEEKFKKVIKGNYYARNKFDCQLNSVQVKELCKLFIAASKGARSKKVGRNLRVESFKPVGRSRSRRRILDEERRSAVARERRYYEDPVFYRREEVESPIVPVSRVSPPPVPHSYVYTRMMEVDAYREDLIREYRGVRLSNLEPRHRDEIGNRDLYISPRQREPPSYRDQIYSGGLAPDYHHPRTLPPEYRLVSRPVEYHSSARVPVEYHFSASSAHGYRPAGPLTEYHLPSGPLPDYHPSRSLYQY
ncbi:hypothetical protein RJ639_007211 [Escallonia herrerae]|uniref:DCD domain-containing protein n=1 Tax=Escallonia herrerae TaxID=1293975 RepID=A0AA89AZX8_9ASTE|nr:hypothetical protein RJ639_007211 [Escallonia herrerae]